MYIAAGYFSSILVVFSKKIKTVRFNFSGFMYILLIEKKSKILLLIILQSFLKTLDLLLLKLQGETLTELTLLEHIHFD